jgi:hypothetical protein
MFNILVAIFFGWPAITASLILCVIGLLKQNYWLLIISAIVAFPFSWFLSGFPIVNSPLFLLPLFVFGAAWAMHRHREMLAWFLAIPYFLTVLLLIFVVSA